MEPTTGPSYQVAAPRYLPEIAQAVQRTADFVLAEPPATLVRNAVARAYSPYNEPPGLLFGSRKTEPFKFEFPKVHPDWGPADEPSFSSREPESLAKKFLREVRGTIEDSKNVLADREFLMQLRDAEATGNYPITGYKNVYPRAPGFLLGLAVTQWNRDVLPAAKRAGNAATAATLVASPAITPFAAAVPQALNRVDDAARAAALTRAAEGTATYSQMQLLEKYAASMAESGGRPDYVGATLEAIYDTAMGSGGTAPMLIGTALNAAEAASIVYESRLLGSLANDRLGEHRYNGAAETAARAGVAGVSVLGGATTDWWFPRAVSKLPAKAQTALSSLPSKAVDVVGAATGAAAGNYIDARLRAADYSRWAPAMEELRDRNRSVYGHPVFR